MARNTSDTPRSRALGARLRHLREEHFDGSLRKFALAIGEPPSTVSKWELGHILPEPEKVGVFLGALGIVGEEQDEIIAAAKEAGDPNWVAPGVGKHVSALVEYGRTAELVVDVAPPGLWPGMLQTEDTARAIVSAGDLTEGQVKAIVAARMSRKEPLLRPRPLKFEAYVGYRVVMRRLGGPEVALNQLRYVQKMMRLKHVTVRVIQETETFVPSDVGPFSLYTFKVGDPIVYFEHHRSSMFAPNKDVQDMLRGVERIKEAAMSPARTAELIADVIKELETTL